MHAKHAKARANDACEIIEDQIAARLHLGRGGSRISTYRRIPVIGINIDHVEAGIGTGLQEGHRQTLMPFDARIGQHIGPTQAEGDISQMQAGRRHDVQHAAREITLISAHFRDHPALWQAVQHFHAIGEQLAAFKLRLWNLWRRRRHRLHRQPAKPPQLLEAFGQRPAQGQFQPIERVTCHRQSQAPSMACASAAKDSSTGESSPLRWRSTASIRGASFTAASASGSLPVR